MMAAILIIGGVNILCSGIIAIYLAKVFYEVKQRPLAIIKEVYNAGDAQRRSEEASDTVETHAPARRWAGRWHEHSTSVGLDA
jgi:hypothetical protein